VAAFVLHLGVVAHRDDVIYVVLEKLAGDKNAQVELTALMWRRTSLIDIDSLAVRS
jgi:hypothetical protein